jgi:hypothetical protein
MRPRDVVSGDVSDNDVYATPLPRIRALTAAPVSALMRITSWEGRMNLITIRATDEATASILSALSNLVGSSDIEVFAACPSPPPALHPAEKTTLALVISDAIRPSGKQTMRLEALRMALNGWDTFSNQKGEGDPALRNAMGALSKALRPFFPNDKSPIKRISSRTKRFDEDGNYLGTRYSPTSLGIQIRDILKNDGVM